MYNIDDMRVGDFFYLLYMMQEECYEHKRRFEHKYCEDKRCFKCKYYEYCNLDIPSIDSISIREAVEGYAKANGLLEHMYYVNQQKWIPCSERLPGEYDFVLVCLHNKVMTVASVAAKSTNETWYNIQGNEIWKPIAWMPLPKAYEGEQK